MRVPLFQKNQREPSDVAVGQKMQFNTDLTDLKYLTEKVMFCIPYLADYVKKGQQMSNPVEIARQRRV